MCKETEHFAPTGAKIIRGLHSYKDAAPPEQKQLRTSFWIRCAGLVFHVRRLLHEHVVWVLDTSEFRYGIPLRYDPTWRALASVSSARMRR